MSAEQLNKCLFPMAGFGTRFLPATKTIPKEMLPIVNKPLAHYGVEEALEAGLSDIGIVTSRGKEAITDYFDADTVELAEQIRDSEREDLLASLRHILKNCTFSFIRQRRRLGLGDAVLSGRPLIGDQPFGVILADDLCIAPPGQHGAMKQMVSIFQQYGGQCSVLAVEQLPAEELPRFGVIEAAPIAGEDQLLQVSDVIEKPPLGEAPSDCGVIGRYLLTPDIFEILRGTAPGHGGELQLSDALREQARQGRLIAWQLQGQRFDCGEVAGFVAAVNHCHGQSAD